MDENTGERTQERRRTPRRAVALDGVLRSAGVGVPCRVHNISELGALVQAEAWLRIGDRVTVEVPDIGAMAGGVVRVSSNTVAIAFDTAGEIKATVRGSEIQGPVAATPTAATDNLQGTGGAV